MGINNCVVIWIIANHVLLAQVFATYVMEITFYKIINVFVQSLTAQTVSIKLNVKYANKDLFLINLHINVNAFQVIVVNVLWMILINANFVIQIIFLTQMGNVSVLLQNVHYANQMMEVYVYNVR